MTKDITVTQSGITHFGESSLFTTETGAMAYRQSRVNDDTRNGYKIKKDTAEEVILVKDRATIYYTVKEEV